MRPDESYCYAKSRRNERTTSEARIKSRLRLKGSLSNDRRLTRVIRRRTFYSSSIKSTLEHGNPRKERILTSARLCFIRLHTDTCLLFNHANQFRQHRATVQRCLDSNTKPTEIYDSKEEEKFVRVLNLNDDSHFHHLPQCVKILNSEEFIWVSIAKLN